VLNDTAVILQALGRLTDALEPMRAGLPIELKRKDWPTPPAAPESERTGIYSWETCLGRSGTRSSQ